MGLYYFMVNSAFTCAVTVIFCGVNCSVGAGAAMAAPIAWRIMGATTRTCSKVSTEA